VEIQNPIEVVVTQPNLDPYTEKFGPQALSFKQQMDSIFIPAKKVATENTDLILAPETAIGYEFLESDFRDGHPYFDYLIEEMTNFSNADLLIGASSARIFNTKNSPSAREYRPGQFVESFNTSVFMARNQEADFIHKSKLVLGVEKIPFNRIFPWLEELSIDLGGSSGSLGIEPEAKVFSTADFKFASLVCYESIYGDWAANFVRTGAEAIFIITNDGWWRKTPGYRQHFEFARLRAVELRRSIARSANTGTSGFINQRGDVIQDSEYGVQTALKSKINLNDELTPYAVHGDIIGRISELAALLILILAAAKFLKNFGQKGF
jgi:apolipoprotein N-acyltransferase